MSPIEKLRGYKVTAVKQDAVFPHYAVLWGRKFPWQKSVPIMQICTHSGMCSDVFNGDGNSFSFSGIVSR